MLSTDNDSILFPQEFENIRDDETDNLPVGLTTDSLVSIYPNPATDYIEIKGLDDQDWLLIILDNKGVKVIGKTIDNVNNRINTDDLFPGMYYVLVSKEGKFHFDKIVIN